MRRGLGKGSGMPGYYNLAPLDSHIHRLSAKGCKTLNAEYNLAPKYDSRKSFYGKARVDDDGHGHLKLYSYSTLVAEINDGVPTVHGTYSPTTLRHIKDFLQQNGFKAENSKQIIIDYGHETEVAKNPVNSGNLVNYIMDYEGGKISKKDYLNLFAYLVKSGQAWTLQGAYGREAQSLIDDGYIDKKGNLLVEGDSSLHAKGEKTVTLRRAMYGKPNVPDYDREYTTMDTSMPVGTIAEWKDFLKGSDVKKIKLVDPIEGDSVVKLKALGNKTYSEDVAVQDAMRGRVVHFQNKENRDKVFAKLKKMGLDVKKTSRKGQVLHPEYVEDYQGWIDTGFGNTMYQTMFPTLYNLEVKTKNW